MNKINKMNNSNQKYKIILTVTMLVFLVLITVGISYAFFTYMKLGSTENIIKTGSLTFVYDEKSLKGNGINLTNMLPTTDEIGKISIGENQVFDFQILASNKGSDIGYEIIADKVDSSTLSESVVKVYLTEVNGDIEKENSYTVKKNTVITYDKLKTTGIENQTGKTIYQENISNTTTNYVKNFRLRLWLGDVESSQTEGEWNYNDKSFSVKINVVAKDGSIEKNIPMMKSPVDYKAEESNSGSMAFYQNKYRYNIKTVNFENAIDMPTTVVESWDISVGQDKSVMAWITGTSTDYTLTIAGDGGVRANPNSSYMFSSFTVVANINNFNYLDTSKVTNMNRMFYSTASKVLNLSEFDTSQVTNMEQMFYRSRVVDLDLSSFDTSNVTNMGSMFFEATNLKSINFANFDTSKVTNMYAMFMDCTKLLELDLSMFDTSQVTNFSSMFFRTGKLMKLDVTSFDTTKASRMYQMFTDIGITEITIGPKWSVVKEHPFSGWPAAKTIYVQGKKSIADFTLAETNWSASAKVIYLG